MSYERNCPADAVTRIFAFRVKRYRAERGWTGRELARKCELSPSTIIRIEQGHATFLGYAAVIAGALGVPLTAMLEPIECSRCDGSPPAGFTCRACGTEGEDAP